MGFATLALFACLLVVAASQGIVYNSPFCKVFGVATATNEWKTKYKTDQLKLSLNNADFMLGSRWRMTTYLKGLLAKIKSKLQKAKFAEMRDLLWAKDKAALHYLNSVYDAWKTELLAAIPDAAKKVEISKIIIAYEAKNRGFQQDKVLWNPGFGFTKCSLS
ncbi:hypothetical protein PRIPAC_77005 [Pristionchus pacificus]|uniref:Uncharacterized protein n=1 Tax=Pristionchus pacificus TaxID=54126 RepID=A0A2A6CKI3_PRIPA|nr:hypothetical protein PRIPAC_77005 [Pristionchus pacificus]|eukprot:PDM78629.1 hypothetical protein PRIPAC_31208 [Pristionchus pacificus]